MAEKPVISISIIHYRVEKEILACIKSIYASKPKSSFEVIVVDNDVSSVIQDKLKKQFPKVRYIKSEKNLGYSGGHNLAEIHAKGEFLFFLNPDTVFTNNILDELVSFLRTHKNAGAVAPLLLDKQKKPFLLQGTKKLGVLEAFVALSVVNKWFPKNPISTSFWQSGWDKTKVKKIDIVPGTAFMIRKKVFEDMGKFDENFFLFFEEYDICRRLLDLGYQNYILSSAKLIHLWGESTKHRDDIQEIFVESRKYYFQKYYGKWRAIFIEGILGFSFNTIFISLLVLLAACLRLYGLDRLMAFIGDFGWFYLSARDLLLYGQIPLVGIPSSHPWLHQGALWTYMLATVLHIGQFDPLSGGYLAAGIGVLTTYLIYLFSKEMFGKRISIFATAFFATSPLIVYHARLPYHTAPIPLFVLLYIYALYKWTKGSISHFPFIILWLSILYNFELATPVLGVAFLFFLIYGVWRKKYWVKGIVTTKIMLVSAAAFLLPMLPMIVYDIAHNFPQTLGYVAWIGYRVLVIFGYPRLHPDIPSATSVQLLSFFGKNLQIFFYAQSFSIAALLAGGSIAVLIYKTIETFNQKKENSALFILFLTLIIPLVIVLSSKIPSDAYLPMLFIQCTLALALFLDTMVGEMMLQKNATYIFFFLICASNTLLLYQTDFLTYSGGLTIKERIVAAKRIIKIAHENSYMLVGKGPGSQFPSFTMNYEYLTWWLGHGPTKDAPFKIFIDESKHGITLSTK